jgi:hypothetical protein
MNNELILETLLEIMLAQKGLERTMARTDDQLSQLRDLTNRISTGIDQLLGKVGQSGLTDAQTEVLNQALSTMTAQADAIDAALGNKTTGITNT